MSVSSAIPVAGDPATVRPASGARRRIRSALPGAVLFLALIALWVIVKYGGHVSAEKMPAPLDVVRAGFNQRGRLLSAALDTLKGALGGFAIGNIAAVLAAIAIASSAAAARLLLPVALVVRTLPIIAIAPLITLLLGYGTTTIITVAAIIIFFPTMVNAVLGLRSVPPEALELMAMANASRLEVLWRVRLPTALPYIFSGLQIGAATCILGAMVAEWVTTGTGLGYLILQAGTEFELPLMWAGVIVAAVMALLVFALTGLVARRVIFEEGA
jgi:NitT/TauT family transport system permease protein